jgi:hypothetical protein
MDFGEPEKEELVMSLRNCSAQKTDGCFEEETKKKEIATHGCRAEMTDEIRGIGKSRWNVRLEQARACFYMSPELLLPQCRRMTGSVPHLG